jgi:hypothetical protein
LQVAIVWLLSLQCIVGTAGLWALQLVAGGGEGSTPNAARSFLESGAPGLFVMATYGPALLVVAVPLALHSTRDRGMKSKGSLAAWAVLFFAVVATAIFYRTLMWTVPLP